MKYVKVTEGEGYISGDYESWCIHPVPFEVWRETMDYESVYPNAFVPKEVKEWEEAHDWLEPKVKYKVTFEVMIVDGEQS